MSRILGFALIFCIAGSILAGAHYYFWARLVRDTQLTGIARTVATTTIASLAFLVVATIIMHRLLPPLGRLLAWPGFIWMGAMFILLVILIGLDLVRLLGVLGTRALGMAQALDASRRQFIARVLAGVAVTGVTGAVALAMRKTRGHVAVKRVEVTLDKLPASLDGTTIVQLCDLHIGGLLGRSFVEQVVRTTNGLRPDVVAIVGDLVDGTIAELRPQLAPLRDLLARPRCCSTRDCR